MSEERELNWDDTIENDGGDFTILPPGDYDFEIVGFERGRHTPKPGSDGKLPSCNKAIVTLRIMHDGEQVDIKHNLFLHTRCEGMLCAFFVGIGQRKHGEPLRPNWDRVVGARGRCKISIRDWKGRDGETMQSNEVKKFYDPAKLPSGSSQNGGQPQQQSWQKTQPPQLPIEGGDDTPF